MEISEIILSSAEFALIQKALDLRDKNHQIDREEKEAEGLKTLIDGLNLLKDASGYVIRPIRTPRQQS